VIVVAPRVLEVRGLPPPIPAAAPVFLAPLVPALLEVGVIVKVVNSERGAPSDSGGGRAIHMCTVLTGLARRVGVLIGSRDIEAGSSKRAVLDCKAVGSGRMRMGRAVGASASVGETILSRALVVGDMGVGFKRTEYDAVAGGGSGASGSNTGVIRDRVIRRTGSAPSWGCAILFASKLGEVGDKVKRPERVALLSSAGRSSAAGTSRGRTLALCGSSVLLSEVSCVAVVPV
jgi:hypothetical protein